MKILALSLLCPLTIFGQAPDYSSLSSSVRTVYTIVKGNLLKSAEKMPEDQYGFKPTESVRSFGQIVGHVADANNNMCAASLGIANPNPGIEKSKTTKADLVAALKAAMELCDKAYDITDTQATEKIKFRNSERVRAGHLHYNAFHSNLHYGNLVTYLRLKNITPPSSER
ncbi:MAG TPA: DinB family protein [Bryobacteraceae bacterium]|nr:DinB family protein [Bryobacteraceae bacterium]